jgi:hypothetical protein
MPSRKYWLAGQGLVRTDNLLVFLSSVIFFRPFRRGPSVNVILGCNSGSVSAVGPRAGEKVYLKS